MAPKQIVVHPAHPSLAVCRYSVTYVYRKQSRYEVHFSASIFRVLHYLTLTPKGNPRKVQSLAIREE